MTDLDQHLKNLIVNIIDAQRLSGSISLNTKTPLNNLKLKSEAILFQLLDMVEQKRIQSNETPPFRELDIEKIFDAVDICQSLANKIAGNANKAIKDECPAGDFQDENLFISAEKSVFGGRNNNVKKQPNIKLQKRFKNRPNIKLQKTALLRQKHEKFLASLYNSANKQLFAERNFQFSANREKPDHPFRDLVVYGFDKFRLLDAVEIARKYDQSFPKPLKLVTANLLKTPCHWIDTADGLASLVRTLSSADEFAMDLENHDTRSYSGFTCLIQISTAAADFLVDAIALHDELGALNEVTADPAILKVFHDARADVMWLQRDFGVFVVNLFDTSLACSSLKLEKTGLSFLLSRYCGKTKAKSMQRADWRIRPLTPGMVEYARGVLK
ncbi:Exosome component 10 [Bonamia ostreae]|uniref:Exosome component 10 n=1 Tax=Bonamia ostreae TaxID=126728 RepID=A0ABV2AK07_9EUKA